jgi:hypothetical protein
MSVTTFGSQAVRSSKARARRPVRRGEAVRMESKRWIFPQTLSGAGSAQGAYGRTMLAPLDLGCGATPLPRACAEGL